MSPLISAQELLSLFGTSGLLIADCSFDLKQPDKGRRQYKQSHIPGALYLSCDDDLSAPVAEHGGRHALPSVETMAALFGRLGIVRNATRVVAYDDSGNSYAARFWWMLRYMGHDLVQVLDGGLNAWIEAGGPQSSGPATERMPVQFEPALRQEMAVSIDEAGRLGKAGMLFDNRAPERYRGETEPIDKIAGHIPGAHNLPWMDSVDEHGRFLPKETLHERYSELPRNAVMYCGSGITASVSVLTAEYVGLSGVRLYPGGWSDWISWDGAPIATGEE